MGNSKTELPSLGLQKLTAWLGVTVVLVSVGGLVWIFDGFVPYRLISANIPTISVTGNCQTVAFARVIYRIEGHFGKPEVRLWIELTRPDCNDIQIAVVAGDIGFGYRYIDAFPRQNGVSEEWPGGRDSEIARFDLARYRDREKVSIQIILKNPHSEELSEFEYPGLINKKGYSEYLIAGTTLLDLRNVQQTPELSATFSHDLDVIPYGASIVEEVPLSRSDGRSFLVNPSVRMTSFDHASSGYTALESKQNWPMQFRLTVRDLQRKRDMFIILFSMLIGVGVSALLESLLSAEVYRALSRFVVGWRKKDGSDAA